MSVVKNVEAVSLNIEVQNGTDKAGDLTYTKKSFSNIRVGVDADSAYSVAEAIKSVLEGGTRSSFLTEAGEKKNISVAGVKPDLTPAQVNTLMDTIVAMNVFTTNSGALVKKFGAHITEKNVTEFEIV